MINLQLSEICSALGLSPPARDVRIHSIVSDSRRAEHGSLFAALRGSHVDGHDYLAAATDNGAVAVLVDRDVESAAEVLRVDNVLIAVGKLARLVRRRSGARFIGITGSNGKTTVKEMLSSILAQQGKVLATAGNYNNELGVPLTLFRLEPDHQYAVIEMGASREGDIAYLAGIAEPEVGLVNNIGPAHLEGFGTLEGTARGKGEMYASLPESGCAIFNGEEPYQQLWEGINRARRILRFGHPESNDVYLQIRDGRRSVITPHGQFELELPLPGEHNLMNALAATAAAVALDVPLPSIQAGLRAVKPVPGRLNLIQSPAGWTVIDDTYNANPASLYSALQVLAGMQGKAWLVLGDMRELGEDGRKLHSEVGDAARSLGVKKLFALGELAAATVDAFGEGGRHFDTHAELIDALLAELRPGINCLVKGSRSMGMEQVVQAAVHEAPLERAS